MIGRTHSSHVQANEEMAEKQSMFSAVSPAILQFHCPLAFLPKVSYTAPQDCTEVTRSGQRSDDLRKATDICVPSLPQGYRQ